MNNESLTRREFTRQALTTVAVAGTADAGGETAVANDRDKNPPAVEDLLLEVIRLRYPDPRLLPAVLQGIRRDLAGDVERSRILSGVPLGNSDEPAFVFAAYRGDAIR